MSNKTAVVLINTGSPSAPTEAALRTYLKDFLSDPRIIELPAWLWQPILRGFILRTRPAKSAARYKKIWMPDGSPLLVYTQKIVQALNERLPDEVTVELNPEDVGPWISSMEGIVDRISIGIPFSWIRSFKSTLQPEDCLHPQWQNWMTASGWSISARRPTICAL